MKIVVSDFAVGRHFTPGQPYSFCEISCAELLKRVKWNMDRAKQGYRDGVLLVPIEPEGIFSSTVRVTDENRHLLRTVFEARRDGEEPYRKTVIDAPKSPAKFVDVVLYRNDVLAEGKENSDLTADWEVISVNARLTEEQEPMTPMTMARNFLVLAGGTKGDYTSEQFAKSIVFWSQHSMATR